MAEGRGVVRVCGVGAGPRKGIGLTFSNGSAESASAGGGNATELGDACGSPGKSCLFFSTEGSPGIGLAGDRVNGSGIAPHLRWRPVRSRRPLKSEGGQVGLCSRTPSYP